MQIFDVMEGNQGMTNLHNPRQRLAHDSQRPQYHFLPPANWMNDPNGLIHWKGQYHLFYQYNPNGPYHGAIHWGHAVSDDLLRWRDLPIALAPTPGGPDAGGCWSGCALDHQGTPTLVYTGVDPQVVCLASGSDDLAQWDKHPANPVIAAPPEELEGNTQGQFRDPFVWKDGDSWRMVIGSKMQGQGGVILHYRSGDLLHWDYQGILLRGDVRQRQPFWSASMWECPNFFRFGERSLLFFSVQTEAGEILYPVYYTGAFDGQQFQAVKQGIMIYGDSLYAPQAMRTQDGRVVMFGWLKEERSHQACLDAGWAGAMSIPMRITLQENGEPHLEPVEELKSLRGEHWHYENLQVTPDSAGWLAEIQGGSLEIEAVFDMEGTSAFGLKLLRSAGGEEETRLIYDGESERLTLDARHSSLSAEARRGLHEAPLRLPGGGELKLRIFVDRSVIEVFAHGACLASRAYPTHPTSAGLDLFALRGSVKVKTLDIWAMKGVLEV